MHVHVLLHYCLVCKRRGSIFGSTNVNAVQTLCMNMNLGMLACFFTYLSKVCRGLQLTTYMLHTSFLFDRRRKLVWHIMSHCNSNLQVLIVIDRRTARCLRKVILVS